jgi:branched-chain amino acid transport system substrate-binding protein
MIGPLLAATACAGGAASDDPNAADDDKGASSSAAGASGLAGEPPMPDDGQGGQGPDEPAVRPAGCTAPDPLQLTVGGLFPSGNQLNTTSRLIAAQLALEDISSAGGVFGQGIQFVESVVDVDDPAVLAAATEDLLERGSIDAVLTVVGSGTSLQVIDTITGRGVIQMSPNNTSTALTDQDVHGLYYRTAPSDVIQGRVLSDELIASGSKTAAVIYRDDPYGSSLANAFHENFEAGDRRVTSFVPYAAETVGFDDLVADLADPRPDAIVVIGY